MLSLNDGQVIFRANTPLCSHQTTGMGCGCGFGKGAVNIPAKVLSESLLKTPGSWMLDSALGSSQGHQADSSPRRGSLVSGLTWQEVSPK